MQPLFWQREKAVAAGLDAIFPPDRMAALHAELDSPVEDEVAIAIVGPFNAGKSTLLNRLLARDILPCRDFTETGTAVRLRAGAVLAASALGGHGRREPIEPSAASLLVATSLLDVDGLRRPLEEILAEVEIEIPNFALPRGTVLIDTPGLNDDGATDRRSLAIAMRAERIVFLLGSRHFLAESDLDHIGLLLAGRDPSTVQLVLNLFIDAPDQAKWDTARAERLPVYRQRLKDRVLAIGLTQHHIDDLVVVCAAEPRDGADMGLADVRRLLDVLAAGARRDALALRKVRIALALHELGAALRERNEGLRREIADRAACVERHIEECARNDALRTQIQHEVPAAQERFAREVGERVKEIVGAIKPLDLVRTGTIQSNLDAAVARASRADADTLVADLRRAYPWDTSLPVAGPGLSALFEVATGKLAAPPEGFALSSIQSAARSLATLRPQAVVGLASFKGVGARVGSAFMGAVESTTSDVQRVMDELKTSVHLAAARAVDQRRDRIAEIEDRLYESFFIKPIAPPDDEETAKLEADLRDGEDQAVALRDAVDRLAGRPDRGSPA